MNTLNMDPGLAVVIDCVREVHASYQRRREWLRTHRQQGAE